MMRSSEKEYDVLVVGEINPDLILSDPEISPIFGQKESIVADAELTIGSSSVIYACGCARLGLKIVFMGVVGDDEFGKFMLGALYRHNIDTSHVIVDPTVKTGFSVILDRGDDKAILTYLGAIEKMKADQVSSELLGKSRHLHLASYFLQNALRPGLPDLFTRARKAGLTISLDTNWDPEERWHGIDAILPYVDFFLPNRNELLSLTKRLVIAKAMQEMVKQVPVVAVKLGADGASAADKERMISVKAPKVRPIADTVGAGDTFDAGFTYGYLKGWDLERTLRLAVACGSLSLRKHGGTAAQPTLEEAERVGRDLSKTE